MCNIQTHCIYSIYAYIQSKRTAGRIFLAGARELRYCWMTNETSALHCNWDEDKYVR